MFPIRDEELTLAKIADYWSREPEQLGRYKELLNKLEQAWLAGDLESNPPPSRAGLLRAMYRSGRDDLVFLAPGDVPPPECREAGDGGIVYDPRIRAQVPSPDAATWTDENCSDALRTLAGNWQERDIMADLVAPILRSVSITRSSFMSWLESHGFDKPRFWASNIPAPMPAEPVTGVEAKSPRTKLPTKIAIAVVEEYFWVGKSRGEIPTGKVLHQKLKELVYQERYTLGRVAYDAIRQLKEKLGLYSGRGRRKTASGGDAP